MKRKVRLSILTAYLGPAIVLNSLWAHSFMLGSAIDYVQPLYGVTGVRWPTCISLYHKRLTIIFTAE
jgi:hypothetical protein